MWIKSLGLGFLALFMPVMAFSALSEQEAKERMLRDVDFIGNIFSVRYAPADWKKRYANWDLATEIELTKDKIRNFDELSIKEYQRAVREFCHSTKDYHVGVLFFSTEWATLPFRVCRAGNKYYITYIDRTRLPTRSFPFQTGDELVMFSGRPTEEVIDELRTTEVGDASPDTDQGLAEICLTLRSGRVGHIVPRGPVTIHIRSTKTGTVSSYQIIWDYNPEKIKEPSFKSLEVASPKAPVKLCEHAFFNRELSNPSVKALRMSPKIIPLCQDVNELAERKSFIPPLGKMLWEVEDSSPFYAYLFETADHRKIGYVRIPHYDGGAFEVYAFADIIEYLEHHSSALIIDQVNNTGGTAYYLYALASLLTDCPLHTPKHRMTITQEDVAFALEHESLFSTIQSDDDAREVLGDSMSGYPVNYQTSQFMLNFFRFIIDEWNAGRTLTKPYYLYGVDCINHHPDTRYTKPILLLVNRLCFSGGDFLPAILQDNKRVTVFGTKTAGAGGYVDGCSYPNSFGVANLHYTGSIAERIDNNPIENLGVTPDIVYEITEQDLQNNFSGYVQEVLNAIAQILR